MTHPEAETPPRPEKLSFEQALQELETIIERIEQGEVGLEGSLDAYKRGSELLKRCRGILDVAEQQIEHLTSDDGPQA